MRDYQERAASAARPGPMDRPTLEALVDRFIYRELPSSEAASIAYAAQRFEERAATLPDAKRVVVAQFAAALRERLARLRSH
jgi:hypothetical protein